MSQFDLSLFHFFNSIAFVHPVIDTLIIFSAAFLVDWIVVGLLCFVFVSFVPRYRQFLRKNTYMVFSAILSAAIARYGVTEIIRFFYNRPRPFETLTEIYQLIFRDTAGSFPSGHAAFSFAIAAVVSHYYPKTGLAFFVAATILSLARVAVGVHWPTDIIGGALIGIATSILIDHLVAKFSKPKMT